jgi:1-acyl-sn-glycerol-3-phosphate acyltransferase
MLVSNHSGVLPFDGAMIGLALYNETTSQRLPRALAATWFPTLPFVSILLQKTGQVQAHPLNAQRLLERDELVVVFPEGIKGVGKSFKDRYQLQRFGRGGFIKVALQAKAPIIPVAVVGAEEIYPVIGQVNPLARLLGLPFFPLTPTWPWTGPLGLVPLPTKWTIDIGPPIYLDEYDARAASNPAVVAQLSDQVRATIQRMLLERLARRRSLLFG